MYVNTSIFAISHAFITIHKISDRPFRCFSDYKMSIKLMFRYYALSVISWWWNKYIFLLYRHEISVWYFKWTLIIGLILYTSTTLKNRNEIFLRFRKKNMWLWWYFASWIQTWYRFFPTTQGFRETTVYNFKYCNNFYILNCTIFIHSDSPRK